MNTMEKNLLKSVSQSRRSNMLPSRKEIEEAVKNLSGQVSFAEQEGNRVKAIHTLLSLAQDVIDGSIFASEREMEDVLAQVGNNCYNEGKGISDTTIAIEVDNALKKLSGHISAPKSALTREELIKIRNKVADKFNKGGKIFIAGGNFGDLADVILSYPLGFKPNEYDIPLQYSLSGGKLLSSGKEVCPHCGELKSIRNPSGYCDHLYYPDNCEICKLATGTLKKGKEGGK